MKIAINGFGRIGRLVFKLLEEDKDIEIVAINDLTDAKQLAYLLKYDSNHRSYKEDEITYEEDYLITKNRKVKILSEKDPILLPWKEMDIDVVFESTGRFNKKEDAIKHLEAGAKKVIISAPSNNDIKTVVYNVNEEILDGTETMISAASCTTNCLAPVLKVLNDKYGIEKGYMTTIHAYTNDQVLLDVSHKKGIESRRGRAAGQNIIPTSTGAASAIGRVIKELDGKLDGSAMRVPVPTGSVIDLTLELKKNVTVEEINETFKQNQNETLKFTLDPIVSSDIISSTYGAVVDGQLTNVLEVEGKQLVKVVAWYDNEMGYTAQMIRTAKYWMSK